jgi:hypothetical protein
MHLFKRRDMTLRSIRNFVLGTLALFCLFPFYGVAIILLVGEENGPAILILCAPYVGYYLFRGLRTWSIYCPRCKLAFFRRGIWFGWPTRCSHCGLSIFDSYDESAQGGLVK